MTSAEMFAEFDGTVVEELPLLHLSETGMEIKTCNTSNKHFKILACMKPTVVTK